MWIRPCATVRPLMQQLENVYIFVHVDRSLPKTPLQLSNSVLKNYLANKLVSYLMKAPARQWYQKWENWVNFNLARSLNQQLRRLKYDGTTKKRSHFGEVQISTKTSTYTVGIKEMASGDADAYVETINSSLESIQTSCDRPGLKQKILDNISNTMTDRHIVNKAANRKLVEQQSLTTDGSTLNNFFCGMHPLDTFAKSAEKNCKILGKRTQTWG